MPCYTALYCICTPAKCRIFRILEIILFSSENNLLTYTSNIDYLSTQPAGKSTRGDTMWLDKVFRKI